ncbi:uncharacterized protein MYCGRDRAFT_108872 [Zymoseptoria tritici IPO323]|uniref:Nephrocystin 3-like N-terminal domain-containing protein n=1 Tax=Zymoseptoria tritici (strain CBS 115943 / IPO323) TaxID=336722 RepID=F9X754_ZYMTI|nr:uncharacterized protein MYCGRDRAFT_108872 [Zymoseptoria tritici IPO323]EGP89078.1 hypothetical protein MYCGRDRAFT_108872 [Zymoseptoria tritici IPO323]
MAEAVALTLDIAKLIKSLIEYGQEVRGAKDDIAGLCRELQSLRGVLEDLGAQRPGNVADNGMRDCLANARTLVDDLQHRMQSRNSRVQRGLQSLKWPFTKEAIGETLDRLARINVSIIMIMMGGQQNLVPDILAMKEELRAIAGTINDGFDSTSRKKIMDYVAPASPHVLHGETCSIWEGTDSGMWFVRNHLQPWIQFRTPEERLMGLYGSSGTGKTTILSRVVEHVKTQSSGPKVAYFYCSFNDAASHEVRNIVGSWLVQLATTDPGILDQFQDAEAKRERIPIASLEDALVDVVQKNGLTLLILDAMNESSNLKQIAECVVRLLSRCETLRCLLSSTPSTESFFSEMAWPIATVNVALDDVNPDIELYVRRTCESSQVLVRSVDTIVEVLVPQTKGMFRWAECQMNTLTKCLTPRMVTQTLGQLPGTLDETYINILSRVQPEYKALVREALMWLSYAYRPFTLDELAEAVVIEVMSYFWMDRKSSNPNIIRTCLTYLLMDPFNLRDCSETALRRYFRAYPFLDYASVMWAMHVCLHVRSGGSLSKQDTQLIMSLLSTPATGGSHNNFIFWIRTLLGDQVDGNYPPTPLYYASSYGLAPIVELMLQNGMVSTDPAQKASPTHIDMKSGRYESTPLQVAVFRGHADVVALLLKHGADPNTTDSDGTSCLSWAFAGRDWRIARLLVDYGAQDEEEDVEYDWDGFSDQADEEPRAMLPYFGRAEFDPYDSEEEEDDDGWAATLRCSSKMAIDGSD